MKKSCLTKARNKNPPVRCSISFACSKTRSYLSVDPCKYLSRFQPDRLDPMAEGIPDQNLVQNSSKEVADCIAGWINYLQMVRGLCNAGSELSRLLAGLTLESAPCRHRAIQCQAVWEQLASASAAATRMININAITSLQDIDLTADNDIDQCDVNQQIVCSGLLSMVNLQYQLSMTCCEKFSHLAACQCNPSGGPHAEPVEAAAVARCFAIPPSFSPLSVPIPQRRWSEAAPMSGDKSDATLRRWSMPWKLALPSSSTSDKSRSTTPDSNSWQNNLVTQEELQDVIVLLTSQSSAQAPVPVPGVTLTRVTDPTDNSRVSSHRGSWWSEGEELDPSILMSRKSSSSTDTSGSCYSLQSRSTSTSEEGASGGARSHLYSMWSGADLPFIKLPESTESNGT